MIGSAVDNSAAVECIAPLPDWLGDRAGVSRREERNDKPDTETPTVNIPAAHDRAVRYLKDEAPHGVEGSRNDTLYKVAARLKEIGVSRANAIKLIPEHWPCTPPLDASEFNTTIRSAYATSQNAAGSAAAELQFEPVEDKTDPELKAKMEAEAAAKADARAKSEAAIKKLTFEKFDDVFPDLNVPALVPGWLDCEAMSVWYGDTGEHKTGVMMGLGFCLALGQPWHGIDVEQGLVIYVALEGGRNIRKRIAALREFHKPKSPVPFALVTCPVDMTDKSADVQALIDLIHEAERVFGQKAVLVVIDTLTRATPGADRNDGKDMGAFVANIDKIRAATSAHVAVVHHTGKDKSKGASGSYVLKIDIDTEITIADHKITASKQRDMEGEKSLGFQPRIVQIGVDAKGEPVTSVVIVPRSLGTEDFKKPPLSQSSVNGRALAVARELWNARDLTDDRPLEVKLWGETFRKRYYPDKARVGSNAFLDAKTFLVTKNYITVEGAHVTAIP